MIYVLYGEHTTRSKEKLRSIEDRFVEVAGGSEALVRIDAAACPLSDLQREMETRSLFRDRRLVVVTYAFSSQADTKQYLWKNLSRFAESSDTYLFWDPGVPLASDSFFRSLKKAAAKVQEFIQHTALKNERKKTSPSLFALLDAVGERERMRAFALLHRLLAEGERPESVFWAVLRYIRNLGSIRSLLDRGRMYATIIEETGLHPYVVKKGIEQVRAYSLSELAFLYSRVSMLDCDIKQHRRDISLGIERALLQEFR